MNWRLYMKEKMEMCKRRKDCTGSRGTVHNNTYPQLFCIKHWTINCRKTNYRTYRKGMSAFKLIQTLTMKREKKPVEEVDSDIDVMEGDVETRAKLLRVKERLSQSHHHG